MEEARPFISHVWDQSTIWAVSKFYVFIFIRWNSSTHLEEIDPGTKDHVRDHFQPHQDYDDAYLRAPTYPIGVPPSVLSLITKVLFTSNALSQNAYE